MPSEFAISIVVPVLLIIAAVFIPLRRLARQREQAVHQRFPDARLIIPGALFYGQESLGVTQMRGTGTLVLTDTDLVFERWLPRKEYRVPLATIQAIETPKSHLGKTNFQPLLKVIFRNEAGNADSMAWLVTDLGAAKHTLEEVLPSVAPY